MSVIIYYYNWCRFSLQAIEYCKKMKLKFIKHNMEEYGGKDDVIKELKIHGFMTKNNKHNTAPIIFINGKFVGGFTELKDYYKNE